MQKTYPIHIRTGHALREFRHEHRGLVRRLATVSILLIVLVAWELVTAFEIVRPFLLPAPEAVWSEFVASVEDGSLWKHTLTTFNEVMSGLLLGVTIGLVPGYFIAKSELLEDLLSPIIVALQATPNVAYAPLLVIWFGSGIESKVVTSALIVFFPMLMNTIVGIRNVPMQLYDLMRVSQATRWQTFIKLEIPAAMPVLMTGLKTAATLSVIGAVVGEFVAANAGLGFLINVARSTYDTPRVYVAVIALAVMAGLLYTAVSMIERVVLSWQRRVQRV